MGVHFTPAPIRHLRTTVDGIDTFYREAGPADAPIVLLPHGYTAWSFVYRNLMAALGDRYRLIAPDLSVFGYSATPSPDDFGYTFDAYAEFLRAFVDALIVNRYVIWLHDYGSQFGLDSDEMTHLKKSVYNQAVDALSAAGGPYGKGIGMMGGALEESFFGNGSDISGDVVPMHADESARFTTNALVDHGSRGAGNGAVPDPGLRRPSWRSTESSRLQTNWAAI